MGRKSFLLMFLSVPGRLNPPKEYVFAATGEVFTGTLTNDAPVECLMKLAKEAGTPISEILCITSDAAKERVLLDGKTCAQLFAQTVEAISGRLGYDTVPVIREIPYRDNEGGTLHKRQMASGIYRQIRSYTQTADTECEMYIDYTGCLRDIGFLMITIIRYLEFEHVRCRNIVYSELPFNALSGYVHELRFMYEMFDLVNGVDQFIATGSAENLTRFYRENEDQTQIRKVTEAIIRFSENIRLCSLSSLDQAVYGLERAIRKFEESEDDGSYYTELFRGMIPMIRKKMYLDEMVIRERGGSTYLNYPQLIRWCLDNDLLQQALTLYVEKLPAYYFRKGYIPHVLAEYEADGEETADEAASLLYGLYDVIADMPQTRLLMKEMEQTVRELDPDADPLPVIRRKAGDREGAFCSVYEKIRSVMEEYRNGRDQEIRYYGKEMIPVQRGKTERTSFLRSAAREDRRALRHYLLYDTEAAYRSIPERVTEDGVKDLNNYRKKEYALELLAGSYAKIRPFQEETFASLENRTYLTGILLYYLAAKMIRNRTNHASERDQTQDEITAARKLSEQFGITIDQSFANVKQILSDGLKASIDPKDPPVICRTDIQKRYPAYFGKTPGEKPQDIDEDAALRLLMARFGSKH